MKTIVEVAITVALAAAFFVTGSLIRHLVILDQIFGLGYLLVDTLGAWKSGPFWLDDNLLLSIFCLLVFPAVSSLCLAFTLVFLPQGLVKRSPALAWLITGVGTLLIYLIQSPPSGPASYYLYWTANY